MVTHLHHRIPRSLLKVYDQGHVPGLEPEDLAAHFEWEEAAFPYGVNPDVSRDVLAALIEDSAVEIAEDEHKASHSAAGDFVRWGRLGGLKTLERYGRPWFALLARRRWGRVSAEALAGHRAKRTVKARAA